VKLIQEKIGNILDHIGIDGTRELHVKWSKPRLKKIKGHMFFLICGN
jgi:hypothetical protein